MRDLGSFSGRLTRAALVLAAFGAATAGCDGGGIPLSLEAQDGALVTGGSANGSEIVLVVKTVPGVDVTYAGQTKSLGDRATESFTIPKSGMKLGKNLLTVSATKNSLLAKQAATATLEWDATPKTLLRIYPAGGDSDAALSCSGTMCGASSFKATKDGKLPIEIESAVDAVVTIDGQKATVPMGKRAAVAVDLLAKLPTATIGQTDHVALAIHMETGGSAADDTLDLTGPLLDDVAVTMLANVEHGPVPFAGDIADGAPHTLVAIGAPASKLIVVGKPGTFAAIDLVGVAKPVERFFGCGKTDAAGIIYTDLDVAVYDRKTGKRVGDRKLRADRVACPPTAIAGQLRGAVREDDIKRVLAELLKK